MKKIVMGLVAVSFMAGSMYAGPKFDKALERNSYASDSEYALSLEMLALYTYIMAIVRNDEGNHFPGRINNMLADGGIWGTSEFLLYLNPITQDARLELSQEEEKKSNKMGYPDKEDKMKFWVEKYTKVYSELKSFKNSMEKKGDTSYQKIDEGLPFPDKMVYGIHNKFWHRSEK